MKTQRFIVFDNPFYVINIFYPLSLGKFEHNIFDRKLVTFRGL
ncbi:Uncharacterised protein [Vibrio cholerae]|nr:Uncharacterised protein [Vibrio cholerae]